MSATEFAPLFDAMDQPIPQHRGTATPFARRLSERLTAWHSKPDSEIEDDMYNDAAEHAADPFDAPTVKPTEKPKPLLSRHVSEILTHRTQVQWVKGLKDILECRVIALIAGDRGTYKTFLALLFGLLGALAGVPQFYCYGEGTDFDRRVRGGLQELAPNVDPATLPIYALERRINLSTDQGIEQLRAELHARGFRGGVLWIDTLSKFAAGLDIMSNVDVSAFLDRMDKIRNEFACAIVLCCHVGHGEKGRAKGASSLGQDTDAEYIVTRDATGVVSVSRERFKSSAELPPLHFKPRTVDLKYPDDEGKPVTSVVMDTYQGGSKAHKSIKLGVNEDGLLKALRVLAPDGEPVSVPDLVEGALQHITHNAEDTPTLRRNLPRSIDALVRKELARREANGTAVSLPINRSNAFEGEPT